MKHCGPERFTHLGGPSTLAMAVLSTARSDDDSGAIAATAYLPWDTSVLSIHQRFRGWKGTFLQRAVRSTYVMSEHQTMLVFTADGEKTFDRHPLNIDRRHKVTIKRYMLITLKTKVS